MPEDIVLGFDFGMKRIGVAVGNKIIVKATALRNISARDGVPNWDKVDKLISEWRPYMLVVGIPLNLDGSKQSTTFAAQKFLKKLEKRFALPVAEVDERLTTIEARDQLFETGGFRQIKNADVDCIAAKLITEQWLRDQMIIR